MTDKQHINKSWVYSGADTLDMNEKTILPVVMIIMSDGMGTGFWYFGRASECFKGTV